MSSHQKRLANIRPGRLGWGLRENFQICRVFVAFSGLFLAYKNEKAHDSSRILNDQSWVFLGALEGTRIPGPLIKSQMLYRLSYERIFMQ